MSQTSAQLISGSSAQSPTFGATTVTSLNGGPIAGSRNRIINGDMRIDQRNAGASSTIADSAFIVDRLVYLASQASKFTAGQNLNSVTPPAGFSSYAGLQTLSAVSVVSSDYFAIGHYIEGLNIDDLAWGTANAQTVTLSFRVYSSLTGTFGGVLKNSAVNRSYPFTYTISSANTWTTISVTVAGDTTGTWLTTNGIGLRVQFGLGVGSTYLGTAGAWAAGNLVSATGAVSVVGTGSATFYITGVQLEPGTVATPFERRSYGQELALCQRYYYQTGNSYDFYARSPTVSATTYIPLIHEFPVIMRVAPTYNGASATFSIANLSVTSNNTTYRRHLSILGLSNTPNLDAYFILSTGYLSWTAEL